MQLAISDAHAALKAAIAKVLGCAWQRCTVHLLRDCLGHAMQGLISSVMRWLLRPLGRAGPSGGSRTVERPTRISATSPGTRFRPTRIHTTLRDVTRSRPTAVGPAIRSQRASDKMRLVW